MSMSSGPVAVDASAVPARGRRDRVNNRHDAPEPAREPRSGSVTSRTSREAAAAAAAAGSRDEPSSETTALKKQLEDKEATIAALRSKLEREGGATGNSKLVGGRASQEGAQAPAPAKQFEAWSDAEEAALRLVEEEARRETEEAIVQVEALAAASLARTSETQASVDDLIRKLKARQ